MRPKVTLREALRDEDLLGGIISGDSWKPWRVLLIASMGEPLLDDERALFTELTGREREPLQPVEEFVAVKGRRGGGSRSVSVLAAYVAGLCEHPALVRGERGVLLCVAADQRQADVILDYCEANFRASPVLAQLVESRTARELRLTNGIDIEVRAADLRRLRGLTFVCVIADEVAFWPSGEDSTNADDEILNAVRPGLATTGGPLFMISSPYARRGELWRTYSKHFGPAGDPLILVAQGSSRTFNPTLPQSVVDRAMERDAASAAAEFMAEFRRNIENFVSIEAVQGCVGVGVYERAPQRGISYRSFCDPSAGSSDAMTLAIGHVDHGRQVVVLDLIRETVPPFSPEFVCEDFCRVLKNYKVNSLTSDRFGGQWVIEQFAKFNIRCEQSAAPKSDLYRDLLPLLNSARIELLDHPKLVSQLCGLERRVARGGRDSIDHAPGAHDDLANCVAGLANINNRYGGYNVNYAEWV